MSILYSFFFVGSLGIFLGILKIFANSCTNLVGNKNREKFIKNRNTLSLVLTGALLTAVTQSSSVVVILIIGLVQGKLVSEKNGLAAVLGAEVGTTMTGQLLSLPKNTMIYILPLLILTTSLIPKLRKGRATVFWFGLLLGSMYLMGIPIKQIIASNEVSPIRSLLLSANLNTGLAILIGFAFTALVQSSSALTALAMNLGRTGILEIQGALGLVIGANLGTCITGFIASFSFNKAVKSIVIGQIVFNFLGVILVFLFFEPFLYLVKILTPSGLVGRQIANGQTLFNILSLLIILPLFSLYFDAVQKITNKLI